MLYKFFFQTGLSGSVRHGYNVTWRIDDEDL